MDIERKLQELALRQTESYGNRYGENEKSNFALEEEVRGTESEGCHVCSLTLSRNEFSFPSGKQKTNSLSSKMS